MRKLNLNQKVGIFMHVSTILIFSVLALSANEKAVLWPSLKEEKWNYREISSDLKSGIICAQLDSSSVNSIDSTSLFSKKISHYAHHNVWGRSQVKIIFSLDYKFCETADLTKSVDKFKTCKKVSAIYNDSTKKLIFFGPVHRNNNSSIVTVDWSDTLKHPIELGR